MISIDAIFIQSHAGEVSSGELASWLHTFTRLTPDHVPVRVFLDELSIGLNEMSDIESFCSCSRDIEIVYIDTTTGKNPTSVTWVEMINYNTDVWKRVLLLETDCNIKPGYVDKINEDMTGYSGWWVYGSTYYGDGREEWPVIDRVSHMNGVAVYNRCDEFLDFVNYIFYTKDGVNNHTNFDWLLAETMHDRGDLYDKFVDSKHIINTSPEWDRYVKHMPWKPEAVVIHNKSYTDTARQTLFTFNTNTVTPVDPKEYILLTTLYDEQDTDRFNELQHCLTTNLNNSRISEVVIFTEHDKSCIDRYDPDHKAIVIQTQSRPTYYDMIKHANVYFRDERIIIANSDIYFDDTLQLLDDVDMKSEFYSLTRWCKHENGSAYMPHVRNSSHPIDTIHHRDMLGLKWFNGSILDDVDLSANFTTYREGWMLECNDVNQYVDLSVYNESTNTQGVYRSNNEPCIWRNELSADVWMFQSPYNLLDNRYKIPLGTFRCDTWLNYLLIQQHNKHKIRLSNPCLSIKTYHHDFLRTDADKNYDASADHSPEWLYNIIDNPPGKDLVHRCFVPWSKL